MTESSVRQMTTEELLTLPDDGVRRWLVNGQLHESSRAHSTPAFHNRTHSRITARLAYLLEKWLESQTAPRGQVLCGAAGCRLRRNPDTNVGVDIAYVAANLVQQSTDTTLIDGAPALIVEILSPSDVVAEIHHKIDLYRKFAVLLIWVIDPHRRTVTIFRLNAEPELVNIKQELTAEPHLPGFRVPVAEVFA